MQPPSQSTVHCHLIKIPKWCAYDENAIQIRESSISITSILQSLPKTLNKKPTARCHDGFIFRYAPRNQSRRKDQRHDRFIILVAYRAQAPAEPNEAQDAPSATDEPPAPPIHPPKYLMAPPPLLKAKSESKAVGTHSKSSGSEPPPAK